MSIIPVNNHILISPLEHKSFITSDKGTYEEIGVVVGDHANHDLKDGDKVFFDSWLCAKYPKNDKEWYWLVCWDDVRAVERKDV